VLLFDVLAVILIVLLCRWGVHRALSPIWDLVGMSKQIAKGRYDEIIPQTKRDDALGKMQNSFVAMQQSIRRNIYNIHATTDEITRHNKEVAYATQMAQEAQERKTMFIQNVMHQIRTPLNIIQGFAQVLRDELQSTGLDNEEFSNIATMMKHNSQHLSRMVLMLYDSSEAGLTEEFYIDRKDQVSCNDLVRECIRYSKDHFPDIPIEFRTELFDNAMILTNRLYLMRTLRELLYNAAKYSDGKHIKVIVTQTAASVLFTVEDVGQGLPQGQQDMVYEFFAKQDDLSEGLGLGLPLAKRHAISLGGNLQYDRNYKEGCRFVITMPK
jgi:signal transduction histidine kinase